MIECRIIESFDEFLKLNKPWNELVAGTEVDHAFMKHEWFAEWIKAFDARDSLAAVTILSDGLVVAIAPLYRTRFTFRGVGAKGLSFLSSSVSPRCNFIAADDSALEILISSVLNLKDWDVLIMENMEENVGVTRRFLELLKSREKRHRFKVDPGRQSPFMLTDGSWDSYWGSLSKKRRYNFESRIRKLQKVESHEFSRITTAEQFKDIYPSILELSEKSWKAGVGNCLRADSGDGMLYANFTPIALRHGWVSLSALKISGKMIGFAYFLCCNNKYSLNRSDYDGDYKQYAPGNTLKLWALKDLFIRDDVYEYDWGGDPTGYKLEWRGDVRKHVAVTVGNRNSRGRLILLTKSAFLPALRRVSRLIVPGNKAR